MAALKLDDLLMGSGRREESLELFASLLDRDPPHDREFLRLVTALATRSASVGLGKQALAAIESSPAAKALEPLVVALKRHAGLEVSAPHEIDEIAADIVEAIRALSPGAPGRGRARNGQDSDA